jgi:hypothetical protein
MSKLQLLSEFLGILLGGAAFGYWQGSIAAGIFMTLFLWVNWRPA